MSKYFCTKCLDVVVYKCIFICFIRALGAFLGIELYTPLILVDDSNFSYFICAAILWGLFCIPLFRALKTQLTVYTVTVKTDATKTVQIKHNNDLYSFRLQFIIKFVLTELKLAHVPVKFPVIN